MDVVDEELVQYVRAMKADGKSETEIREKLLAAGWDRVTMDQAIQSEFSAGVPQPTGPDVHTKKVTAGLLALLLGGVGAHKFYLGDTGMGILYLCFFWTGIPAIAGLIEGILYLTKSDDEFFRQYMQKK